MKNGVAVNKTGVWRNYKNIVMRERVEVDCETYERVKDWLNQQLGKGYDWMGILSFIWFFITPKEGKWYCSELAYVVLMKIFDISQYSYDQKVTPQQFYYQFNTISRVINSEKKDIIVI